MQFKTMTAAGTLVLGLVGAPTHAWAGDGSDGPWVQIADSVADFTGTQGENGWFYGYADGLGEPSTVYAMGYFSEVPGCGCGGFVGSMWHFAPDVCFCGQQFCFITAAYQHGDTQGQAHVPVRRFNFPAPGLYRIDTNFEHDGGCGGSNPVGVELRHQGNVVWSAQTSPAPVTGSVTVVAGKGDFVELWSVMLASECGNVHVATMTVSEADCNGDGENDYTQIQAGQLPDYNGNFVPDCCEWGGPCFVGAYPVQWTVANGGNGHWYMTVPISSPWADAVTSAIAAGAHLATFTNLYEHDWVAENLMVTCAGCKVWIGGVQDPNGSEPGDGWGWHTGESPFSVRWYTGSPDQVGDEDCAAFKSTGSYKAVTDQACGNSYHSIIEWDADCNGDGIVDLGQILDGTLGDTNGNGIPDLCDLRPGYWSENGHWYGILEQPHTWDSARIAAEDLGGHLVTLTDGWEAEAFENLAINPMGVNGNWWLGGLQTDASGGDAAGWEYVDGTPFWADWWPGEPNHAGESALAIKVVWGQLGAEIDEPRDAIYYAAIEWDADCNGDGIVDFGQIYDGVLADLNHNYIPDLCECEGDVILDGEINGIDLAAVLTDWGTDGTGSGHSSDLNGDGSVDAGDLTLLLSSWGPCSG